jgi:hypothetical protein
MDVDGARSGSLKRKRLAATNCEAHIEPTELSSVVDRDGSLMKDFSAPINPQVSVFLPFDVRLVVAVGSSVVSARGNACGSAGSR